MGPTRRQKAQNGTNQRRKSAEWDKTFFERRQKAQNGTTGARNGTSRRQKAQNGTKQFSWRQKWISPASFGPEEVMLAKKKF